MFNMYCMLLGVEIIRKSLKMPCTQIAMNAGVDAAVVTQKVLDNKGDFGYDAMKGEYVNMIESGIIDPTKVCIWGIFKFVV